MANQQLVDYIKNVQSQGFTDAAVLEVLSKNGWQSQDIEEAFSYLKILNQAPMPAGTTSVPAVTLNSDSRMNSVNSNIVSSSASIQEKSPYAVATAAVLFAALLIFLNSLIDDTSSIFGSTLNAKFIFDIAIIFPFLALSFIIQSLFSVENRKHFSVVFEPYFVVSGFLLVRLIWNVSSYLLSANTTYGVYVVLLLVILVLTGIILFVQNYIKK